MTCSDVHCYRIINIFGLGQLYLNKSWGQTDSEFMPSINSSANNSEAPEKNDTGKRSKSKGDI